MRALAIAACGTCAPASCPSARTAASQILLMLVLDRQRDDVGARRHGDVLRAVEHVGHGRRLPGVVGLKDPERLAVHGIRRHQTAAVLAENHQPAGGGQGAAPGIGWSRLRHLPPNRAGPDVDRFQNPLRPGIARRALRSAEVGLAALPVPLIALRIDAEYRLSPWRSTPLYSLAGLPVGQ